MSISYSNLGNYGRLGNQMFQFASLKGIAKKHNYNYIIPENGHDLFQCFAMSSLDKANIGCNKFEYSLQERYFDFDEDLYKICPDNIDLLGYFQSEKYFKFIRQEILTDFTFHKNISDNVAQKINTINSKNIISLHIRRGDYIKHPIHGDCCDLDYYKKALSFFDSSLPVVIVTDDQEWVKKQKIFQNNRFYLFKNDDENLSRFYDLCIMSVCSFHIIANSSFSWWGSWLSQSLRTIAPKKWFNLSPHRCWHNIYCEDWILV